MAKSYILDRMFDTRI